MDILKVCVHICQLLVIFYSYNQTFGTSLEVNQKKMSRETLEGSNNNTEVTGYLKHNTNNNPSMQKNWSSWTPWSTCNKKCIKKRTKFCVNKMVCRKQRKKQSRKCVRKSGRCAESNSRSIRKVQKEDQEAEMMKVINSLYGQWSTWSPCTRSCKKRRYRECNNKKLCNGTILMEDQVCRLSNTRCARNYSKKQQKKEPEKKKKKQNHHNQYRANSSSSLELETLSQNLSTKCGKRKVAPSLRIIGGHQSTKGSWPWQVAILTRWKEQYCGGVLITPQWVLTAAHCLMRKGKIRRVILRTNEYNFGERKETGRLEKDFVITSKSVYIHPNFNMQDIDSDIALVKLHEPVTSANTAGYACIPDKDIVLPDETLCYAVGWGKTKETHLFGVDVLQEAPIPLVKRSKCEKAFEFPITKNQMCAGHWRGGIDTCAGDSGGPLMCKVRNQHGLSKWHVYGVTSFGEGCGEEGKYGIYTIVRNFQNWILRTINSASNSDKRG